MHTISDVDADVAAPPSRLPDMHLADALVDNVLLIHDDETSRLAHIWRKRTQKTNTDYVMLN